MTRNVLYLIRTGMDGFSKGQKRIANYILSNYDKAAFMTACRLGQPIGAGLESCQTDQGSGFGHPMETVQPFGLTGMIVAQVILSIVKGGIGIDDLKNILPSFG